MFTPHELDVPADGPGTLRLGAVVAGKYRIKRLVGKGGMGAVYKAENTAIGRTVAIKVLHSHLADDGVTLTLGMGGVTAEVLAYTVTLVLPATEAQVL